MPPLLKPKKKKKKIEDNQVSDSARLISFFGTCASFEAGGGQKITVCCAPPFSNSWIRPCYRLSITCMQGRTQEFFRGGARICNIREKTQARALSARAGGGSGEGGMSRRNFWGGGKLPPCPPPPPPAAYGLACMFPYNGQFVPLLSLYW